jgi:hypothetical protein
MEWSWIVFFIALPITTIISMFCRGAMNAQNVAKCGPSADYRDNLRMAILGSIVGGALWAAIITTIVGLF